MPKYRMAVQITGTRNGQDWPKVGAVVELPKDEGDGMLAAGLVVEAATKPQGDVETATVKATPRRGRSKS